MPCGDASRAGKGGGGRNGPRASGDDPDRCVYRGVRPSVSGRWRPCRALPASTRRRRSLPALKKAVDVSRTETSSPVLGSRPTYASRRLTVNTPKPRSSTRSPRASMDAISLKMVATAVSTSPPRRCGVAAAISAMSPDLVKGRPAISLPSDARRVSPRQHEQGGPNDSVAVRMGVGRLRINTIIEQTDLNWRIVAEWAASDVLPERRRSGPGAASRCLAPVGFPASPSERQHRSARRPRAPWRTLAPRRKPEPTAGD
jgi:hypothetical protein